MFPCEMARLIEPRQRFRKDFSREGPIIDKAELASGRPAKGTEPVRFQHFGKLGGHRLTAAGGGAARATGGGAAGRTICGGGAAGRAI
jgi:hypothetical protein